MHTETYIPNHLYRIAVMLITASLNRAYRKQVKRHPRPVNPVALHENAIAALHTHMIGVGVDLGGVVIRGGAVTSPSPDLAQALADLRPGFFEEIDADDVKIVLGEVGNIWPASSRPEDDAGEDPEDAPVVLPVISEARRYAARRRARAAIVAARRLALAGGNVPREHLAAIRADHDRQAAASVEGVSFGRR